MQGPFWSGTISSTGWKGGCRAQPVPFPLVAFVSSGQCCSKYLSLFNCCVDMLPLLSCFFWSEYSVLDSWVNVIIVNSSLISSLALFDCYVIVVVVIMLSLSLSLNLFLFDCCIIVVIVIFVVLGISSLSVWLLHCFRLLAIYLSLLSSSHYLGLIIVLLASLPLS